MITLKDIYKSVCEFIAEKTEIQIADSDLEEPVIRPSYKIFMDTVDTGFFSSAIKREKVYFNIYYYAKDNQHSKSEIMEVQDIISSIFMEPFMIKENAIVYVDDLKFEKVADGILNCSFNFEIGLEFIDESELEEMEQLSVDKV